MSYTVYILRSLKDGSYYIGCTSNLKNRINTHNKGKTQSLKHKRPLEIIYKEDYTDATKAFNREKQIKSYKSGGAFKKLIHIHSGGFA